MNTDPEQFLYDVRQAGDVIKLRLGKDALAAYKTVLMQIATEVAKAYCENQDGHDVAGADTILVHVRSFFAGAVDRFVTK